MSVSEITEQEIQAFEEQGVMFLAVVLSEEWVGCCRRGIDYINTNLKEGASDLNLSERADEMAAAGGKVLRDGDAPTGKRGRFFVTVGCWMRSPAVREFVFDSPVPGIIAKLLRSDKLNLYDEQILVKEPGAVERTAFHQDQPIPQTECAGLFRHATVPRMVAISFAIQRQRSLTTAMIFAMVI